MAVLGPKRAQIDTKIDFFKNLRKPFFLTTEGSIYSNFQASNPKNVIRSARTDAFLAQKGQKLPFLAQKGQNLTQKNIFLKDLRKPIFLTTEQGVS